MNRTKTRLLVLMRKHVLYIYYGSNGANLVYSFLPTSGTYTSLSGDLNAFIKVSLAKLKYASDDSRQAREVPYR